MVSMLIEELADGTTLTPFPRSFDSPATAGCSVTFAFRSLITEALLIVLCFGVFVLESLVALLHIFQAVGYTMAAVTSLA
jgi:hypothetical protein